MKKKLDKPNRASHTATRPRGGRMKVDVLLRDGEKFSGQYVAMKSFTDREIITSGTKPEKVMRDARKLGFTHPVMLFVPSKDSIHIF